MVKLNYIIGKNEIEDEGMSTGTNSTSENISQSVVNETVDFILTLPVDENNESTVNESVILIEPIVNESNQTEELPIMLPVTEKNETEEFIETIFEPINETDEVVNESEELVNETMIGIMEEIIALADSSLLLDWIYPTSDLNVTQHEFFNVTVNVTCLTSNCDEVNVSLDPVSGTVYNFTSCGITGNTGPSQGNCDTSYTGTTLAGAVTVSGGIQNWTVPTTGTYTIETAGAVGGYGTVTYTGGLGARMTGTFELTAGQVIQILVGQSGEDWATQKAGGGGGGSFVVDSTNDPLIIAGGGGAGGGNSNPANGQSGLNETTGGTGSQGVYAGGADGAGGGASAGTFGGAGFSGDGGDSTCTGAAPLSFLNGGTGGQAGTCSASGGDGGFGGGSGGEWCCQGACGAGGGYSGGGGTNSNGVAGGGGSVNNGTNQNNTAGINAAEGYVSITYAGGAKDGLITTNTSATPFYTTTNNPYNVSLNDGESEIITWYVNATGDVNSTHEFFVFANWTTDLDVSNTTDLWNVTIVDFSVSPITIDYPVGGTSYLTNISEINYTIESGYNLDPCWYSADGGVTNSTNVSAGTNFTGVNSSAGSNTWTVYCNDSNNLVYTQSVTFSKIPVLGLTMVSPLTDVNVTQNETFTISTTVSCSNIDCGAINVSLDPAAGAETIQFDGFESNFTDPWYDDGVAYSWTRNSGGTSSSSTGPSSAYSGTYYIYVETSSGSCYTNGQTAIVYQTPAIDFDSYTSEEISWYNNMYGSNIGTLILQENTTGSWINLWNESGNQGTSWFQNTTDLSSLSGTGNLRFHYTCAGNYRGDTALDNINISGVLGSSTKSGLVSMNTSATPFFTITQNPYNLSLDDGQSETITWTVNATGSLNTTHEFFVYANWTSDQTINNETSPWNITILENGSYTGVDVTGPVITFDLSNNYYSNDTGLDINYSTSELNLSSCWYSNDSMSENISLGDDGNCTNITSITWSESQHNVTIWANDSLDNNGSSSLTFTIDFTNPNGTLISPENNTYDTTNNTQNFTVNLSDNIGVENATLYVYNSSGSLISNITTTLLEFIVSSTLGTVVDLADGVYTWFYELFDWAGNTFITSNSTVTVDATNPLLNVVSPENNTYTTDTGLNINYTVSDFNLSSCWYSNDSMSENISLGNNGDCTNITSITWLEGEHNLTIWVNDSGGYQNTSTITFTIDVSNPSINLISPENNTYKTPALQNFTVNLSDNIGVKNATLYVYNSSNELVNQTSDTSFSEYTLTSNTGIVVTLADDNYTWYYDVFDRAENTNTSLNYTVVIDATDPVLDVTSFTNNTYTNNTGLNINYTVSETYLESCWYSNDSMLENTTLSPCQTNITTITWSEGQHNVTVWANDSAGNEKSSLRRFTIDTIYPTISIDSPSNGSTSTDSGLDVTYLAADTNLESCWYSNDSFSSNITLASCTTNITDVAWSEGQHNITIWTNDSAGQVNSSVVTFSVDSITPSITIDTPSNNTYTTNTGLNVNYTTSDTNLESCWYSNDSMLDNITLPCDTNITTITWSEGPHNVTIWANDSFGNLGNSSLTFTIDTISPVLEFVPATFDNATITTNTSVEVNVSITETNLDELTYNWNGTNYTLYNDSLILMYNFDKISDLGENDSSVVDISGNSNDGAASNGAAYNSSGKFGGAFSFAGDNDFLNIPDITLEGEFTISFWWNINHDSSYRFMLGEEVGGTSIKLGHNNDGTNFFIRVLNGGSADTSVSLPSSGEWHHLVLVRDSSNKVDLYVNAGTPNRLFSDAAQSGNSLWSIVGSSDGASQYIDGSIDELRFWNRSLSNDEIYQDFTSNLKQTDSDSWELYVNQSKNASNTLSVGPYTYQTFVTDKSSYQNQTEQRTLTISSGPTLTIDSPTTNSFTTDTSLDVLYTATSATLDSCWYSTDSGGTNTTLTDCANITSVTWEEGEHNITVYANDSGGESTSTVIFTVDVTNPAISISIPTNNTYTTNTGLNVNYTASDTNLASCWYSNDSMLSNTTLADCTTNITSLTWSEGQHNVTVWVNDSAGNVADTSVTFIVDVTNPSLSITSPINNSFSDQVNLDVNYSVSDTNLDSCWYSNDSMTSNNTLTSCSNLTDVTWSEQQHSVSIWVNDSAGNLNNTDVTFTIDTSAIIVSITNPSSNFYSSTADVDVNYTISGDNIEDCWYTNDSYLSNTTLADCGTNITGITWSEGQHNVTVYANDSVGNLNSASITFYVDLTDPTVNLIVPTDNLIDNTIGVSSTLFNCTTSDNINLANISLYLTNATNQSFALNQTSSLSGVSDEKTWNLSLGNGNYTWNCLAEDFAGRLNWSINNYSLLVNATPDTDTDGLPDYSDPLLYNESNVTSSGLTRLNISIGGNRTNETFSGKEDIFFYDDTELMVNFSYNFSVTDLDLSNVSIIKDTNYLIINLSGQLQSNYNKTVYLENNEFVSLCVKDEEISSIDEISSGCTGSNETDLTTCLTANISVGFDNGTNTTTSIGCGYDGTTFSVSNLQYSGIKGTVAESSTSSSSSGGGGGGGSSGGGGGAGAIRITEPGSIDEEDYECDTHDDCSGDKACFYHQCVKLFDIKILEVDSPIGSDGYMGFTYFVKGMANFSNDIIIDFWLEKDGTEISSGRDTIYLGSFEEKTESTKIFVPKNLSDGNYNFYVQVGYENYVATAKRTVYVEVTEDGIKANLVGQAIGDKINKIIFDLSWLWIILVILLILIGFGWKHKHKLKYQIVLTDRRNPKRSLKSKQRELVKELKYKEFAKKMVKLLNSRKYKKVIFEEERVFVDEKNKKGNRKQKTRKFLHDYFGMFKTDKEKEKLLIIQEQALTIKKIEKDKQLKQSRKRRLELKKKWRKYLHDNFGMFKTNKENENFRIAKEKFFAIKKIEDDKKVEQLRKEKLEFKRRLHKFFHDRFGMFKTDKEKANLVIVREQALTIKKKEKDRKLKQLKKRKIESKKKWHDFFHDNFGMFKTDKEKEDIRKAKANKIARKNAEKRSKKSERLRRRCAAHAKKLKEKREFLAEKRRLIEEQRRMRLESRRKRRKFFHDYFGMFKTDKEKEDIQKTKEKSFAIKKIKRDRKVKQARKEKLESRRKRRKFFHDYFGMFKTYKEKADLRKAKANKIARKNAEKRSKKSERLKRKRAAHAKKLKDKRNLLAEKRLLIEEQHRMKLESRRKRRKFFHDYFGMFKTDKEKEAIQRAKANKIARKRSEIRLKKANKLKKKRNAQAKKSREKREHLAEKKRIHEEILRRKREIRRKRRKFFHDHFGMFKTDKEKADIRKAKANKIARKNAEKRHKKAEQLRIKRAARAKKLKEKRDILTEKRRLVEAVQRRKRESRRKRRKFFHDNFGMFKTAQEKEAIRRAKANKIARKRRKKELKKKYREEKRIRKQEEKIKKVIVKEKIKLFEKRKKEEEKVKDQVEEMKAVLAEKKHALNEEERRTHEKLAEIKRQQRKKQKKEERKIHLLKEKKVIMREVEKEKERTIKIRLKLFEKKMKR